MVTATSLTAAAASIVDHRVQFYFAGVDVRDNDLSPHDG